MDSIVYKLLGSKAFNEIEDLLFDIGEGFAGVGAVDVVDGPVLDFGGPVGELADHHGSMFFFLEGDDFVGGSEIFEGELSGSGAGVGLGDVALLEEAADFEGDGAVCGHDHPSGEATGEGAPLEFFFGGVVVENGLGESAAVVVAGADEEDFFHAT